MSKLKFKLMDLYQEKNRHRGGKMDVTQISMITTIETNLKNMAIEAEKQRQKFHENVLQQPVVQIKFKSRIPGLIRKYCMP